MKTKKLKKRLDKLETSLNCLIHHLVEKPLQRDQETAAKKEEEPDEIDLFFDKYLQNKENLNRWIPFMEIRKEFNKAFDSIFTGEDIRLLFKDYCERNKLECDFRSKPYTIEETNTRINLPHYIVVK